MKILHLGGNDKFLPPFIDFVEEHFNPTEHEFLLTSGMGGEVNKKNVIIFQRTLWRRLQFYLLTLKKIQGANKIILHGLFDPYLIILLYFNPWVLEKCYWCIWGGDLYDFQSSEKNIKWEIRNFLKHKIIPRIGHLVTYIPQDIEKAIEWYGATGTFHECIGHQSNLYQNPGVTRGNDGTINILIGNSATSSNNHACILQSLAHFKEENIRLYVPLSYGDTDYAASIIKLGHEIFGTKFKPITEFLPRHEYMEFLAKIDIAIFNHARQQAMGNTIALLGMGKTVYLKKNTAQWNFLVSKGILLFDAEHLLSLKHARNNHNAKIIENYFSEEKLIEQWTGIFYGK